MTALTSGNNSFRGFFEAGGGLLHVRDCTACVDVGPHAAVEACYFEAGAETLLPDDVLEGIDLDRLVSRKRPLA